MIKFLLTASVLAIAAPHATLAAPKSCPPGLAKKAIPCVPPGQAKKGAGYGTRDVIRGDYIVIRNPGRYGLDPDETYYRVGDNIYRVDRDTREILDFIGAATAILN